MDVFQKIYQTVANVLPGNPLLRDFCVNTKAPIKVGLGNVWTAYCSRKKSTRNESTIFICEKKLIEQIIPNKTERETIYERIRQSVLQLMKLHHPNILTMQYSMEESSDSFVFVTEPIISTLADFVCNKTPSKNYNSFEDTFSNLKSIEFLPLTDIEIKYGIKTICQALNFLHSDAKIICRLLCPESIVIDRYGNWKLFDFTYSISINDSKTDYSLVHNKFVNVFPLNYDYLLSDKSYGKLDDIFGLAILIYNIHNISEPIYSCQNSFELFSNRSFSLMLKKLPFYFTDDDSKYNIVRNILLISEAIVLNQNRTKDINRFLSDTILTDKWFENDSRLQLIEDLQFLLQIHDEEKINMYKKLEKSLGQLPMRVRLQNILSKFQYDLNQPNIIPVVLPVLFSMSKDCNTTEFYKWLYPVLKPIFLLRTPIQICAILLEQIPWLIKHMTEDDIQDELLPIIKDHLDLSTIKVLQLLAMDAISKTNLKLSLNEHFLKNYLLPKFRLLSREYIKKQDTEMLVHILFTIGSVQDLIPKNLMEQSVFSWLLKTTTVKYGQSSPTAIVMSVLGILKKSLKQFPIEKNVIAEHILPFLIPICIQTNLNQNQYKILQNIIHTLLNVIEKQHLPKLDLINANELSAISNNFQPDKDQKGIL